MPNNPDVYDNHLAGDFYRSNMNDTTKLVSNTKFNDKKLNKNYLDELNKEGYRLIKWSNEMANLNKNNQDATQYQNFNMSSAAQLNNLNNSQLQQNYNAASSNFDNFNYYGKENVEKEELLGVIKVLYNNYNNLLKKYYELNEQNNSYLEGIREYQHKLDNSNYVIQLLNSSHSNYNKLNLQQQQDNGYNLEENKNTFELQQKLLEQQELLHNQQVQNKEKEEELNKKLEELNDKLKSVEEKEQQLDKKLNELDALLLEENNKLEELKKRQLSLAFNQKLSVERENSLRDDESVKHEQLLLQLLETQRNDDNHQEKLNKDEVQQTNVVEKKETDDQLLLLNNINTDIINSIYIKTLNDNNSGMHVVKKGMFNKLKTKNCKLVVKDMNLCLVVGNRLANQFNIENLSKLEYGQNSLSYKLYYKSLSYKWPDENCYLTVYAYDKRCFNVICDSKEVVSIWFNSLNSLLYSLNGPPNNDSTNDKLNDLYKLNGQQLTRQNTDDSLNSMMNYLNEFNKLSVNKYYTDSLYNNIFNVLA